MDRFEKLCEEFGGTFEKTDGKFFSSNSEICIFDALDDFKAFAHWMKRQKTMPKGVEFIAKFELHEGTDFFKSTFTKKDDESSLFTENERSLGDGESFSEYFKEKLSESLKDVKDDLAGDIDWRSIYNETAKKDLLEDKRIPPYVREDADVEVGMNNDWDYQYVKGIVLMKLQEGSHLSSMMEDAETTVDVISEKAEERFYEKLDEEINMVIEKAEEKQKEE